MNEAQEFSLHPIAMPRGIVLGAAGEILMPPQSEMDLAMAFNRRGLVEHELSAFTEESIRDCRPGQRVLLLRDLFPSNALPAQDDLFYEQVIDSVTKTLTDLRLRLREDLRKTGVEVLMEEGLLTTSDIPFKSPGKPYGDKAWARLRGSRNASGVSLELDLFVHQFRSTFFGDTKDSKMLKASGVVCKMIANEGKVTVAEAQRELAGIFGVEIQ